MNKWSVNHFFYYVAIKNWLLGHFPDWPTKRITENDFNRLHYDRKSEGYQEAIKLGKLILLQLNPQIQSGSTEVVAIFFDMNDLFERYISKLLRQKLKSGYYLKEQGPQQDLIVKKEENQIVQKSFKLKPDIVVGKSPLRQQEYITILDTKWKNLDDSEKKMGVSQTDLYQLYTYAGEYEVPVVGLIYPKWGDDAQAHHYEYRVGPNMNTKIQLIPWDWDDENWAESVFDSVLYGTNDT